jgi:shikimate kinase
MSGPYGTKEWKNYDHLAPAVTRGPIPVISGAGHPAHGPEFRNLEAKVKVMSDPATQQLAGTASPEATIVAALGQRSLVLVGMMGSGKSSIGRRLASRLDIAFVDADVEIEKAAGMSIPDIFATRGEEEFRAGEARVILRLLESGPQVLATGGGAVLNADTRASIAAKGISIWLKAEVDVLLKRIRRRHDRPLLKTDDPGATLRELIAARYPVYALSDLTVQSREVPHDKIVDEIVSALAEHMGLAGESPRAAADEGHAS